MVNLEEDQNWLKYEDFAMSNPLICEVLSVELVEKLKDGKKKQDIIMSFLLPDKNKRQASIWGDNKNKLIKAWGKDTDLWKGKFFSINQEEVPGGKSQRRMTAR